MNIVRVAALGVVWLGLSQAAEAQTVNCVEIAALPAVISEPGVYCLKKNFSVSLADDVAIAVLASNVTIDFNGFKIGNMPAGEETLAVGVGVFERRNVVLRNGNFRGFMMTIGLLASDPEKSSGHLVENMMIDSSLVYGIFAVGNGLVLRNNQIVNSADTRVSSTSVTRMLAKAGAGGVTRQLRAMRTARARAHARAGAAGVAPQIDTPGVAPIMAAVTNSVIEKNTISSVRALGEADGIVVLAGQGVAVRDNFIAGLRAGTLVAGIGVSDFSDNILLQNNTILDGETTGADTVYGIESQAVSGVMCLNNVIAGFSTAASYGCVPATCDDGRADACTTPTTGAVSNGRVPAPTSLRAR
ncbi:right-handed parallel beta-helix repeat-containing protein [Mesorhizobium australicum]|uniref:Right handed beta helix region n=1 Tax=Mesorhizobium australicum TaxID=536018 RepID=A0A1X7NY11_9HYPH|nr:right-handed parallel beta-helix repeat-containing protein [Mesorhizobium australicum]SMH42720.1 Right handed beta helix region [Mesorhizobium australicum]